jgi:ribonuclease VapC
MIVADTSALVAVVFGEAERGAFVQRIESAERVLVSAVTAVETRMVVSGRRGPRGVALLDELFRLPMIEVAAVGVAEMDAAYAAFVLYGRGSGHPAALNFGDVFSYALAKVRGAPLLFKGNDFARTDIRPALDRSAA